MASGQNRRVDLCILGGGPAGLAVASRVARGVGSVLIVESGDRRSEANADLKVGSVGPARGADHLLQRRGPTLYPDDHLESGRFRGVGGSGNLWGVRQNLTTPFTFRAVRPDPLDFVGKPAFDIPRWPIPGEELAAYLDAAASFVGMPRSTTNPADWNDELLPMRLDRDVLPSAVLAFPHRTTITEDAASAITSAGVETLTGTTVVRAHRAGGSIRSIEVVRPAGDSIEIHADRFVVALGGVENARLLLHLADLGVIENTNDVLGRFFTDHPHARLGIIEPAAPIDTLGFYDFRQLLGHTVLGVHHLDAGHAHREDLLGFSVTLTGRPRLDTTQAAAAATAAMNAARDRRVDRAVLRAALPMFRDPKTTAAFLRDRSGHRTTHHTGLGGWSDPAHAVTDVDVLAVESMIEQRPSADNRVVLTAERDRLGLRRARLEWSWSAPEVRSYWRSVELVRDQVAAAGIGRFLGADELGAGPIPNAGSGWHHMGTTRMASDATEGVVDTDSRLHELDNVYVAGSSVFPSSAGWANPTLTVLAMSLRLGDHLRGGS